MNEKKVSRLRRARRSRIKIRELGVHRLCVNKSNQHIYAQIIAPTGSEILVTASTLDKALRDSATSNIEAAKKVGALIAEKAKTAGIENVAFDRAGFKYHGRIKALADAARDGGLKF